MPCSKILFKTNSVMVECYRELRRKISSIYFDYKKLDKARPGYSFKKNLIINGLINNNFKDF